MKKLFGITTQKENCCVCTKRVYINEKVTYDSKIFHAECFRCKKCNCKISISSVGKYGTEYYCYTHMMEEFKTKGSFRHTSVSSNQLNKIPTDSVESIPLPEIVHVKDESSSEYPEWLKPDLMENGFRYIIDKDMNGKITVQKKALKDVDTDDNLSRPESPVDDGPKKKKFGFNLVKKKEDRKKSNPLNDEGQYATSPSTKVLAKIQEKRRSTTTLRVRKYFGVEYDIQMEKETFACPRIIIEMVDHLVSQKAYEHEGIFRISGVQTDMEQLLALIEAEKEYDFMAIKDIHTISSLLKLYFRSLPSPFFSHDLYVRVIMLPTMENETDKIEEVKSIIEALGVSRKYCFGILLNLFSLVLQKTKVNMMDSSNLSTVIGINLLKDMNEDPSQYVTTQHKITKGFKEFLDNYAFYSDIFAPVSEEPLQFQ